MGVGVGRIGWGGRRENCSWDVMSGRIKKKKRLSSWNGNRWEGREGLTDSKEARTWAFCPSPAIRAIFSFVRSRPVLPNTNKALVFVQLASNELSPLLVLSFKNGDFCEVERRLSV